MPDNGRFLYRRTHSPDLSADGTIFPVPHTSSPRVHFSWFCHGLLGEFGWIHEMACPTENTLFVSEILNWRVQKLVLHPAK